MQFIDKGNNVTLLGNLADQCRQPLLELPPILSTSDNRRHIEHNYSLVEQIIWHILADNPLREALNDGRLTYPWLTQQDGVVLGTTAEDRHKALGLARSPYHSIELTIGRLSREINAVFAEGTATARHWPPLRVGTGARATTALFAHIIKVSFEVADDRLGICPHLA